MGIILWTLSTEVIDPPPSNTSIFQVIGAIGGLAGLVALLTLPWTVRKLRAETRSIEVSSESAASDAALKHMKAALEEADKTLQRFKEEAQAKIVGLEQQVFRLRETLEAEREKSEHERELHERRVVQLLYELRAKDLEISQFRQGKQGSI